MKELICVLIGGFLFLSCNNQNKNKTAEEDLLPDSIPYVEIESYDSSGASTKNKCIKIFEALGDTIFGEDTPLTEGCVFTIDVFPYLWYSDIYTTTGVFTSYENEKESQPRQAHGALCRLSDRGTGNPARTVAGDLPGP